jgi:NitT/TauT family transport system ATP-binding protein
VNGPSASVVRAREGAPTLESPEAPAVGAAGVAAEVAAVMAAQVAADVYIQVRGLSKEFGGTPLYEDFSLDLPRGKIVSVFGPNGCGKSTLINMIAGLVPMDRGTVRFGGRTLRESKIGYVFQNYRDALFPWKRAIDNIRYPLALAGRSKPDIDARVDSLVDSFAVGFDLHRYPYELSGGQQQLISIMRALAPEPEVLFLDEPFSALDYEMTLFMREKLEEIYQATGLTMVLVSHDLEEAVCLSDEVLLLTRRPTRVAERVRFEAPRPRTAATLATDEFVRVKAHCLEVFQTEVRRKAPDA